MKMKRCSICRESYPQNQMEFIYNNGTREDCCQFCLEGIRPTDLPRLTWDLAVNYHRTTGTPLGKLVNI